jgi:hypothetical protein
MSGHGIGPSILERFEAGAALADLIEHVTVLMPKAMLVTTATLAAKTPTAPLMPQNHGVGPELIAETKRMPVGNP